MQLLCESMFQRCTVKCWQLVSRNLSLECLNRCPLSSTSCLVTSRYRKLYWFFFEHLIPWIRHHRLHQGGQVRAWCTCFSSISWRIILKCPLSFCCHIFLTTYLHYLFSKKCRCAGWIDNEWTHQLQLQIIALWTTLTCCKEITGFRVS